MIVWCIDISPVLEILGIPVSFPLGDEQIVVVLKDQDNRLAATIATFVPYEYVEWVGKGVPGLCLGRNA